MTHGHPHVELGQGFGGSSLDTSCEECREKIVGGLDDKNFELLAGLTRSEFEIMLQAEYDDGTGTGIYNFWYAIMGANALKCFARKEELHYRLMKRSHG